MPCQFLLCGVTPASFLMPSFSGDTFCIQSFHGNSWETIVPAWNLHVCQSSKAENDIVVGKRMFK